MEKKYYDLIVELVKNHRKYAGLESILDDIVEDVYNHAKVVVDTISNEDVIESYLNKVVSTSIITVPKRLNFNTRSHNNPTIVLSEAPVIVSNDINIDVPEPVHDSTLDNELEKLMTEPLSVDSLEIEPSAQEASVDEIENINEVPSENETLDIEPVSKTVEEQDIVKDIISDDSEIIEDSEDAKDAEAIEEDLENSNESDEVEKIEELAIDDSSFDDVVEIPFDKNDESEGAPDELYDEKSDIPELDSNINKEVELGESESELHELTEPSLLDDSENSMLDSTAQDADTLLEDEDVSTYDKTLVDKMINGTKSDLNLESEDSVTEFGLETEPEELTAEENENFLLPEGENSSLDDTSFELEKSNVSDDLVEDNLGLEQGDIDFDLSEENQLSESLEEQELPDTISNDIEKEDLAFENFLEENEHLDLEELGLETIHEDDTPEEEFTVPCYDSFAFSPDECDTDTNVNNVIDEIKMIDSKNVELNIYKVYDLKYNHNLSVDEIASELNMSEADVVDALTEIIYAVKE